MGDGNREIEYRIKTVADVRALQATKKGLEENIKVTKELGQSTAVLEKELQKASRALDSQRGKAGQAAAELQKTITVMRKNGLNPGALVAERNSMLAGAGMAAPSRMMEAVSAYRGAGGGLAGLGAGAAAAGATAPILGAIAGVAAVAGVGAKSLKEYADAEERVARLDAALANRAQLVGKYREELQELASTLQGQTGASQSEWISVITKLVQFGANEGDIHKATEGVKNLAGLLGGDLQSAAMMVGKALHGEFTAFSRLGLEFDKNATQTQNLEKLWKDLAALGGGQLEAANDTLAGSFKILTNGANDLFQLFGGGLAKFLSLKEIFYGLGTTASWFAGKLSGPIEQSKELKNSTQDMAAAMKRGEEAAKREAQAFDAIKQSIAGANEELQKFLNKLKEQESREQQEIDAKLELEEAQIDVNLKAGRINPAQAALSKARARESHAEYSSLLHERAREMERSRINEEMASQFDAMEMASPEGRTLHMARMGELHERRSTLELDSQSARTVDAMRGRVRGIQRSTAVNEASPGGIQTIAPSTVPPGTNGNEAIQVMQKQIQYWMTLANNLSRVVNLTEHGARQLETANANVRALEGRIATLESQLRNGRR